MMGSQKLLATDTAAKSVALTWPAMMVSTSVIAVCDTCATRMGEASRSRLRLSLKNRCTKNLSKNKNSIDEFDEIIKYHGIEYSKRLQAFFKGELTAEQLFTTGTCDVID